MRHSRSFLKDRCLNSGANGINAETKVLPQSRACCDVVPVFSSSVDVSFRAKLMK